jgi:hypothetical protein
VLLLCQEVVGGNDMNEVGTQNMIEGDQHPELGQSLPKIRLIRRLILLKGGRKLLRRLVVRSGGEVHQLWYRHDSPHFHRLSGPWLGRILG